MKSIRQLLSLLSFLPFFGSAQDCESIVKTCESYLNGKGGNVKFISDGQVYTAFLDREKAEFKTTFFDGHRFRCLSESRLLPEECETKTDILSYLSWRMD